MLLFHTDFYKAKWKSQTQVLGPFFPRTGIKKIANFRITSPTLLSLEGIGLLDNLKKGLFGFDFFFFNFTVLG